MRSKKNSNKEMRNGVLVVNKPSGMTSHDVVDRVRRIFKQRRVGHAGTLDPLATGVLVILLGQSTKLFSEFVGFDKAYRATLILGRKTTSADIQGETIEEAEYSAITPEQVENVMVQFRGEIDQLPPMVSAVKVNGSRLYKLARKGIEVKREPRRINIAELKILRFESPEVEFFVDCSKGTYVRKLAEDIGDTLGCLACISQIERTKVGPFTLDHAVDLSELGEKHICQWDEVRPEMTACFQNT